jgi:hypothetical protein
MAKLKPVPDNPFDPGSETQHAGKVFVLTQGVLRAGNATASDRCDISVLADRFLLCLWDVDDGTSLWIALQSNGDYDIAHANKRLYAGRDPNWMDASKVSRYRDGTIWRMGSPGRPFRHTQQQQRAITKEELTQVQSRISKASIDALVPR